MSFTAAEYKSTVKDRASFGANFRRFRYNNTELGLMPNCDHLGNTERPGLGDVEYVNTYRVWVGQFEVSENSLPTDAFMEGAEWEMSEDQGSSWIKMTVMEPPKRQPQWYEMLMTPALLT